MLCYNAYSTFDLTSECKQMTAPYADMGAAFFIR